MLLVEGHFFGDVGEDFVFEVGDLSEEFAEMKVEEADVV